MNYPAIVANLDKDKVIIDCVRGPTIHGVFVRGKLPKLGNKGIAVIEDGGQTVKFRGPKGAGYFKITSTDA